MSLLQNDELFKYLGITSSTDDDLNYQFRTILLARKLESRILFTSPFKNYQAKFIPLHIYQSQNTLSSIMHIPIFQTIRLITQSTHSYSNLLHGLQQNLAIRTSFWMPQVLQYPTEKYANRSNTKKNKRHTVTTHEEIIGKGYSYPNSIVLTHLKRHVPHP